MVDWNENVKVKANGKEVEVSLDELRQAYASVEATKADAQFVQYGKQVAAGMQGRDPYKFLQELAGQFDLELEIDADDAKPMTKPEGKPDGNPSIEDAIQKALGPVLKELADVKQELLVTTKTGTIKSQIDRLKADPRIDEEALKSIVSLAREQGIEDLEFAANAWRGMNPPKVEEAKPLPMMQRGASRQGVSDKPVDATMDNLDAVLAETMNELQAAGKLELRGGQLASSEEE